MNTIPRISLGLKISIGYAIITSLVIVIIIFNNTLFTDSNNIAVKENYLKNSDAFENLRYRIRESERLINELSYNPNTKNEIFSDIDNPVRIGNVKTDALGVNSVDQLLSDYQSLIDKQQKIFLLLQNSEDALDKENTKQTLLLFGKIIFPTSKDIVYDLKKLNTASNLQVSNIIKGKNLTANSIHFSLLILLFSCTIIGGFSTFYSINSVQKPLYLVKKYLGELSLGKLPSLINSKDYGIIAEIISEINNLINSLQLRKDFTKSIGKGHFLAPFKVLSPDDELGKSLIVMRDNLKAVNEKEAIEKWEVYGKNTLGDIIQKATSIDKFGEQIISSLVDYLDVNQASIYIIKTENSDEYYRLAAFGQNDNSEDSISFEKGTGLLGDIAKTGKTVNCSNMEGNKRKINTGFIDLELNNVLIVPLITGNEVNSLIELASIREFEEHEIRFMEEIGEKIAYTIYNLVSHKNTENLLQEIELKNKELLSSEEELKQNAEETNMINEKLATSHTELEASMAELMIAKKEAELANQSKTQFLSNMSHEIRSPLNAIVGFSQILENQSIKFSLPYNFKENLGHIIMAGQNLSELINNILDLSKIESGKMDVLIESINFKQLFMGIFHINKANTKKKGIDYSYNIAPRLPEYIQSDRTKLNQILMNLVSNAIKFTPKGKLITLEADEVDGEILIKIKDQGIGIAEDRLDSIFESFEQADNTITRSYGGTGLGLSISKNMVELLGGKIWVESEIGVGSTFFLKIPLLLSNNHTKENEVKSIDEYHFSPDNIIVAVEDIELNQKMIKGLFDELDLEVHFAFSALEGIKKIKDLKPDIVLMDIHMPGMDGIQATKEIRKITEFKSLPIIALSADAFIEQQQKAFQVGVNDYITKPIDFNKLLPVLSKYLKQDANNSIKKIDLIKLPTKTLKKLTTGFKEFLNIPLTDFEVLDLKIQSLKELCLGYNDSNFYLDKLEKIDNTIFSGEVEKLPGLVNAILIDLEQN